MSIQDPGGNSPQQHVARSEQCPRADAGPADRSDGPRVQRCLPQVSGPWPEGERGLARAQGSGITCSFRVPCAAGETESPHGAAASGCRDPPWSRVAVTCRQPCC